MGQRDAAYCKFWRLQVRPLKAEKPFLPDVTQTVLIKCLCESSYIDDGVELGAGTKIWHFSHVMGNCALGENCTLGQNVVVGPNVTIGNNVKIQNNVSVFDGVTLEDGVFCGPSCVFTNVINPRSEIVRRDEFRKTVVRKGGAVTPMRLSFAAMIWVNIALSPPGHDRHQRISGIRLNGRHASAMDWLDEESWRAIGRRPYLPKRRYQISSNFRK